MRKTMQNNNMGRPLKGSQPRDKRIQLRVSQVELDDMEFVADKLDMNRTDAIVHSIEQMKDKIEKDDLNGNN